MLMSKFSQLTQIKAGLLAVAGIAALSALSGTQFGQRLFAQVGIGETLARTVDAAERVAQNGGNAVQSFLARSPGERGAIDILKGKSKRELAQNAKTPGGPKPSQRALGKIFDEPLKSLAGPVAPAPIAFIPLDSSAASFLPAAVPLATGAGAFSPLSGGIPTGGGFFGGGGGGGGSTGPGDVAVTPAPPVSVAAVPEPSTWILLLIGFAAVGASIRRAKPTTGSTPDRAGSCVKA